MSDDRGYHEEGVWKDVDGVEHVVLQCDDEMCGFNTLQESEELMLQHRAKFHPTHPQHNGSIVLTDSDGRPKGAGNE